MTRERNGWFLFAFVNVMVVCVTLMYGIGRQVYQRGYVVGFEFGERSGYCESLSRIESIVSDGHHGVGGGREIARLAEPVS